LREFAHIRAAALWLSAHAMDRQPTGLSVPAFFRHRQAGQAKVADLMAAPAPNRKAGGAGPMVLSRCAPKGAGIRKSETLFARQLATTGLQLAAAMMTRTRIIQRFTRGKFTLFRCKTAELFFFCCGSIAAPRQRPRRHDQVPAKNNGAVPRASA
jgi:hypothetical protein